MERNIEIKNNGEIGFYIIKYVKELSEKMLMEEFTCWYVSKMIIPYCHKEGKEFQNDFWQSIGFKKEPTIDKIYFRLKTLILN